MYELQIPLYQYITTLLYKNYIFITLPCVQFSVIMKWRLGGRRQQSGAFFSIQKLSQHCIHKRIIFCITRCQSNIYFMVSVPTMPTANTQDSNCLQPHGLLGSLTMVRRLHQQCRGRGFESHQNDLLMVLFSQNSGKY